MDSPIWERQPGEPLRWFERFTRYRLMGATRSIDRVYLQEEDQKGPKGAKKPKKSERASGAWRTFAQKWEWTERAEAWDLVEAEAQRIKGEEQFRRDLDQHRENCLTLSRQGLATTVRMLKLVNLKLEKLLKKAEQTPKDDDLEWLEVREIPNFVRSIAAISATALESEALTLEVQELLLKDDASK